VIQWLNLKEIEHVGISVEADYKEGFQAVSTSGRSSRMVTSLKMTLYVESGTIFNALYVVM
jgi:hypothetical protein